MGMIISTDHGSVTVNEDGKIRVLFPNDNDTSESIEILEEQIDEIMETIGSLGDDFSVLTGDIDSMEESLTALSNALGGCTFKKFACNPNNSVDITVPNSQNGLIFTSGTGSGVEGSEFFYCAQNGNVTLRPFYIADSETYALSFSTV